MIAERLRRVLPWRALVPALLVVASPAVTAEPPAPPPLSAQAAHQVAEPEGLWSRLLRDERSPVRSLDPAIFTELSPVSASDPAVRLPEDQREADWDAAGGAPAGAPR